MEGYKSCVHLFEKIKAGSPFKKRTAHYGAIYRWAATVDGSGAQLDGMEGRNVNRILNSTMRDVRTSASSRGARRRPSSAPNSGPK